MNKNNIIQNIVFLPQKFYTAGNNSMYSLLKESGYFAIYGDTKEDDIEKVLNKYPENIKNWLVLSENKRTASGWYFKQDENGKYIVGYFPPEKKKYLVEYGNAIKACASFIKKEIEEIRNSTPTV